MRVVDADRVQIRVKIEGFFNGVNFVYEDPKDSDGSQYIWINAGEDDNPNSEWWWREGNMACDCNRWGFLPDELRKKHNGKCGHKIDINRIIPLEGDYPILLVDGYEDQWN